MFFGFHGSESSYQDSFKIQPEFWVGHNSLLRPPEDALNGMAHIYLDLYYPKCWFPKRGLPPLGPNPLYSALGIIVLMGI